MLHDVGHDITGIILVGGKSRRMGRDKAFLEIAGIPLIDRVLAVFRQNFERILLVGDREERFSSYNLPVVPDIYPGSSLGGLYTGLCHAETEYIFVSSCDLPFPNADVLRFLCSLRSGFDAVVPSSNHGYEPLFAVYSRKCLGPVRELLESGNFCAYGYYSRIKARFVGLEELAGLDPEDRAFLNVNTPDDLGKIGELP